MITRADETAIGQVPAGAWKPGIAQDGTAEEDKDVAEVTHLMSRAGNWPGGLRWIARRVKPSRRQAKNLTDYEKRPAGATPSPARTSRSPGSAAFPAATTPSTSTWSTASTPASRPPVSAPPRPWACAPSHMSKAWQVNAGWVIAANIAADLTAWTRLLGHHDDPGLREANPDTLRYRVWHLPARLARHARQRALAISPDWPWADAFLTCWQRLCALPAPA